MLDTIFLGEVASVQSYGAFVRIPGSSNQGLVHRTQISKVNVPDASEVLAKNDRIWCKVVSVGDDGKIALSMKVVDQGSGKDLDPNGVQMKLDEQKRKEWVPGGKRKAISLDAVFNTTCSRCGTLGHLSKDCFQVAGGKVYDLLPEETEANAPSGTEQLSQDVEDRKRKKKEKKEAKKKKKADKKLKKALKKEAKRAKKLSKAKKKKKESSSDDSSTSHSESSSSSDEERGKNRKSKPSSSASTKAKSNSKSDSRRRSPSRSESPEKMKKKEQQHGDYKHHRMESPSHKNTSRSRSPLKSKRCSRSKSRSPSSRRESKYRNRSRSPHHGDRKRY